jgi:hypothetical protein
METTPALVLDADVARLMPALRRVVVPTDRDDAELDRARRAATLLAGEHDWELVLYDRSHETWMDHPHPSGPVSADELDGDDWEHLRIQLNDIEAAGVTAKAWLATVPSLSAMTDVVHEMGVDAVLLPEELDKPTLADRVLDTGGGAEPLERAARRQSDDGGPLFLELSGDGRISRRSSGTGGR